MYPNLKFFIFCKALICNVVQCLPMKFIFMALGMGAILVSTWVLFQSQQATPIVPVQQEIPTPIVPTIVITPPPESYVIPQKKQVFQSFNNCGPASLSMLFSYQNLDISQEVLGQKLRPYQNLQGDNDDKSVTVDELANEAIEYDLISYHRPHGSMELLKTLISNDIPVLVRTLLEPNEDIGHYRIVRGYDDVAQEILQDDSYQGGNLHESYDTFIRMWQPFNYEYMIAVSVDKKELVEDILKKDVDIKVAWEQAYATAETEEQSQPGNPYPIFNQSVALYHLGDYEKSRDKYEEVSMLLPRRTLWYQTEPIQSYLALGGYEQVFVLTDTILSNENRGYAELYLLRAEAYKKQGNTDAAREEIETAIYYNKNLQSAQTALLELQQL